MDLDQIELDASYDQAFYAPLRLDIINATPPTARRCAAHRTAAARCLRPDRRRETRYLPTKRANAPVFVFIHGGAWLGGEAKNYAFPAEMFVNAGAHYVALDFIAIKEAGGDLRVMAEQVRRGIAWVYKNAASFRRRSRPTLYRRPFLGRPSLRRRAGDRLGEGPFGLPADAVKGGLCMSGMYDMKPVRLSKRSSYVKFTDEMEQAMSSQRHLTLLRAPIVVTYGTDETPEFQRQSRDFAAAVKAAGSRSS